MHNFNDSETIPLDQLLGDVSLLRRYSLYTREPLMMKPKYSNDRIARQSAIFMVFPNEVTDKRRITPEEIDAELTGEEKADMIKDH